MPAPTELPSIINDYLAADRARDVDAVVATFAADAEVVDEANTYRGTNAIRAWRDGPAALYDYDVKILHSRRDGCDHVTLGTRLTGDFPGGVANLEMRFSIRDGLISRLEIAPVEST